MIRKLAVRAATIALMTTLFCPALVYSARAADVELRSQHLMSRRAMHRTMAQPTVCSAGWWQTLRWGKVRPRYGVRCHYRVASR
jgi:hypothetical protein